MWGEFEDENKDGGPCSASSVVDKTGSCKADQKKTKHTQDSHDNNTKDDGYSDDIMGLPLRDRLLHHLAASNVTVKSQQRYEPDLTYQERKDILSKLLSDKPGQFLYRFGKYMRGDELQYFVNHAGDPEVDHYLPLAQQHHNPHTARIRVRNRRYAAMQRLRKEGDYFSEKEMERRHPLLYDQLIGRHQTEHERNESCSSIDRSDLRFSSILLEHIDLQEQKKHKKLEEEQEDDMLEEEDSDEEEEKEEELLEEEDGETGDAEKRLYREEFYSASYSDFLTGGHKDFDYEQVDASDEYDLIDIRARDDEESYFDRDSDDSPHHSPSQMEEDADVMAAIKELRDAEDNMSVKPGGRLGESKYDGRMGGSADKGRERADNSLRESAHTRLGENAHDILGKSTGDRFDQESNNGLSQTGNEMCSVSNSSTVASGGTVNNDADSEKDVNTCQGIQSRMTENGCITEEKTGISADEAMDVS